MKPPPPVSLLPAGFEWRVVEAKGWQSASRQSRCSFEAGRNGVKVCHVPAVAAEKAPAVDIRGKAVITHIPRCEDHLGSIRWMDGDTVMAWRAERSE